MINKLNILIFKILFFKKINIKSKNCLQKIYKTRFKYFFIEKIFFIYFFKKMFHLVSFLKNKKIQFNKNYSLFFYKNTIIFCSSLYNFYTKKNYFYKTYNKIYLKKLKQKKKHSFFENHFFKLKKK